MSSTVVALWVMFMLGAASMFGVMKFSEEPLVRPTKARTKKAKPDPVAKELEETQEWLGVMKDDRADSLDLVRYRYKWKENPLLAIGTKAKQLALTAKPHSFYEMKRIQRYILSRPVTISKPTQKERKLARIRQ